MLGKVGPSDVVTETRIDHLARSTFDLFAIVKRIGTEERGHRAARAGRDVAGIGAQL
jgi:hypothetical protein